MRSLSFHVRFIMRVIARSPSTYRVLHSQRLGQVANMLMRRGTNRNIRIGAFRARIGEPLSSKRDDEDKECSV